mmetsp:Transcript_82025/g.149971  ORF Transcript_82025/g.149971 Transcript_82025/m.149971 type:complete len:1237 (-) Transcript_82025:161-3871(-)
MFWLLFLYSATTTWASSEAEDVNVSYANFNVSYVVSSAEDLLSDAVTSAEELRATLEQLQHLESRIADFRIQALKDIAIAEQSSPRLLHVESQLPELQQELDDTVKALTKVSRSDFAASDAGVKRRRLADSASSESAGDHEAHGHQHDALVYLILVLVIGTAILHLTTTKYFHKLPYTVVLFVLGVLSSLFYKAFAEDDEESFGVFARSYEMWMKIDPHLLIFTMLPVLLTGDAMTLDTAVAKRVSSQCLWLAGPGVLMGSFGAAAFLRVYLGWDFLVCLACGSILAATDPVAVVGLLKELGASPTLTVQIQGESLLNDGTAMVLFNVAYNMLKGEEHNVKSILILLVYMVGCSWFMGMVVGGFFSSWIKAAGKRFEHHSNMIQISLTICCAYGSFVFAEGVIGISGVLSTVAAALVLADNIWVKIVNPEAMHEVWHTFEYIGNTLIFFLAGALSGLSLWLIDAIDVLHLLVIYVFLLLLRATIIFGSRPVLKHLNPDKEPVTAADAAVMTWGGLRGAVGLALSITLMRERADGNIPEGEANRVFFFTAGIAFLTLIVNATTCPQLVKKLGIARCPESKNRILRDIVQRLEEKCEDEEDHAKVDTIRILEDVKDHLHNEDEGKDNTAKDSSKLKSGKLIVKDFKAAKRVFETIPELDKHELGWHDHDPLAHQEEALIDLVLNGEADASMVRTINESFLQLVQHQIWHQIQQGEFAEGTKTAEILLGSNTKALYHAESGLSDYAEVAKQLGVTFSIESGKCTRRSRLMHADSKNLSEMGLAIEYDKSCGVYKTSKRIVKSAIFQGVIMGVIMLNAVVIFMDPGPDSPDAMMFMSIDCCFMCFYLFELVIKLIVLRVGYFMDGWNALDFLCVLLGLFAIATTILVEADVLKSNAISSEMLLIRLGRIVKLIRVARVASLLQFVRKMKAKYNKEPICPDLARHLDVIFTLRGLVQAHLKAHKKFLQYFGANNVRCENCQNKLLQDSAFCRKCGTRRPETVPLGSSCTITGCEHARCILESWTEVFNAAVCGSLEIQLVDGKGTWILEGLCSLRDSSSMAKELTSFVLEAAEDCVILAKDAERIIHPMYEHLRLSDQLHADTQAGIHRRDLQSRKSGRRGTIVRDTSQFDIACESTLGSLVAREDGDSQEGESPGTPRVAQKVSVASMQSATWQEGTGFQIADLKTAAQNDDPDIQLPDITALNLDSIDLEEQLANIAKLSGRGDEVPDDVLQENMIVGA